MTDLLQYPFMRNALAAGLLVSVACGIVGTFVVVRRMVFISGGIAHAAYGGVGLGYLLGVDRLAGALAFSLLAALGMGMVQRRTHERADTIIGVLWAMGMALGIIGLDLSQGYKADLMSYLFGSILTVSAGDLALMAGIDAAILALVCLFYKELVAVSFDEQFATVANVPVAAVHLGLLGLIALTVVVMMRVVGLIMVIALLTIPAAIAGQFAGGLRRMMLLACLLGMGFTLAGLTLSYALDLTSGATIILVAGTAYLAVLGLRNLRLRNAVSRRMRWGCSASDAARRRDDHGELS